MCETQGSLIAQLVSQLGFIKPVYKCYLIFCKYVVEELYRVIRSPKKWNAEINLATYLSIH